MFLLSDNITERLLYSYLLILQTVLIQVMVGSNFNILFDYLLMYFVLIIKCFIYILFLEVILVQ